MELARRLVSGRLAEVVGAVALPIDRENRTLGLVGLARAQLDALPRSEREVLEAYARGVNAGSRATGRPVEAILLGIEPEPWTPLDSLLVLKYMEKLLGLDGDELDRHRLAVRVGPEVAAFVEDFQGMVATTILPDRAAAPRPAPSPPSGLPAGPAPPGAFAPEAVRGSNAWVVAGSRTKSGKPLLANDTHLAAAVPSIWYQAHVSYPGVDVVGMTIAGSPYCVVGHNARVAWGSTTLMADQVDYVRLELDRPRLLGHSLGAVTVGLLASSHGNLARSVVLEDPPFLGTQRSTRLHTQEQQIGRVQAALGQIVGQREDRHSLGGQVCELLRDARRLGLPPAAEREPAGVLRTRHVVDRVAAQHDIQRRAGTLQRVHQPDDRVVLLFDGRAVGALDDAQYFHGLVPRRLISRAWG